MTQPLRKITGKASLLPDHPTLSNMAGDLLECGHVVAYACDRNGELDFTRKSRRCPHCTLQPNPAT